MKRAYAVICIALSAFALSACGGGHTTEKKETQKFYAVKITDVRTEDDDWIVKGTTNAPDGAQVVAITDDSDSQMLENSSVKAPTVKHGKFAGTLDGVLPDDNSKVGDKTYVYIAASTPKKVATSDDFSVKKKYIPDIQQKKFEHAMKFSNGQIKYYKSLDDDSDQTSDEESSSESSANAKSSSSSSSFSIDDVKSIDGVSTAKKQSDRLFVTINSASFDKDFIPVAISVLKQAKDSDVKYIVLEGKDDYTNHDGDVKSNMSRLVVFENGNLDLKKMKQLKNFYGAAKEYMFNPSDYSREKEQYEGKSNDFDENDIKDHKYDASSADSSILVTYYSKQMGNI